MQMKRRGNEVRLVIGDTSPARIDPTLIKAIARAHGWFQELVSGRAKSLAEIALREGIHKSDITKKLSLAFLAPDIIETIIAGQQPAELLTGRLVKRIDLPLQWAEQRHALGFA
jgi:ParB-like chromosome segregation protein Spo0J